MEGMSLETDVLRALSRLSRRRLPATMTHLLHRVAARPADVRRALATLVRSDLVLLAPDGPRLTMAGLAVACAAAAVHAERAKLARIVPLERRAHKKVA